MSEENKKDDNNKKPFWETTFGRITVITALIVAITGLINSTTPLLKGCGNSNSLKNNNDTIKNSSKSDSSLLQVASHRRFNTDTRDKATVQVSNYTKKKYPGGTELGGWTSSIKADVGDTISVKVYYHNCTENVVSNVFVGMRLDNTDVDSIHIFRGSISINDSIDVLSKATVCLSTQATLIFISGSVRWYPNQSIYPTQLLSTENLLFTKMGFFIGDIKPGWPYQGSVVASFLVQ
ncbi:MAG: hypothetical protein QM737_18560 [Ferruginibacter sp.]